MAWGAEARWHQYVGEEIFESPHLGLIVSILGLPVRGAGDELGAGDLAVNERLHEIACLPQCLDLVFERGQQSTQRSISLPASKTKGRRELGGGRALDLARFRTRAGTT